MAVKEHTRGRVKPLHVYEGQAIQRARGTLWQLREAGHVPSGLSVDEPGRVPVEWRDAQGRRHRLRPYATHLWEAVLYRLPDEAKALRQAQRDADTRWSDTLARARRRAYLEGVVATLPRDVKALRARALDQARRFAVMLPDLLFGRAEERVGGVDEASLAAVDDALRDLLGALERARYRFDAAAAERLRTELRAFDARDDEQLQRFLADQVEAAKAP
jgi:hypothetical protein